MVPAILFALLLAGGVGGVAYVIVARRFHQTPEYEWRQRVFRHAADLAERRRRLVAAAPPPPEVAVESERSKALRQAVGAIPLDRLTEQPGIGPGAIALLRQVGVSDVPTAARSNLEAINGIGPQKAASLRFAASRLIRDCEQDFAAGRNREGAAFAGEYESLRVEAQRQWDEHQRRLASFDAAIAAHRDSERLASRITLFGFARKQVVPGLDATRMQQPSPTPDTNGLALAPPRASGDLPRDRLNGSASAAKSEPARRHPQLDRMEAFARFGVSVALADGRSAQAELKVVRAFLADLFGHEPELLRRLDPLIERCRTADLSLDDAIAEAKRQAPGDDELRRLHRWAEQIADASSGRTDRETALLRRIADQWELAAEAPSAVATPTRATSVASTSSRDPRMLLGIPADVEITADLVRRRYRLVVDQLDAARLDGLGDEFTKLAALKRQNVEAAALALLKPLGAPLEPPAAPPPPADPRHNPDLDAVFGA